MKLILDESLFENIDNDNGKYKLEESLDQEKLCEDTSNNKFHKLQDKEFFDLLDNSKIINKYFDKGQFEKLQNNGGYFYCQIEGKQILSAAYIVPNKLKLNDNYINEIQSLVPGYGKSLLQNIIEQIKNIWLMSQPGNDKLISYYDGFNLNKVILDAKDSIYNVDTYYYTNIKNIEQFYDAIYDYYTKGVNLEEDTSLDAKQDYNKHKIIEESLTEARKKKKRKKSKNKLSLKGFGWWPIYIDDENHNCGNMEYNNDIFNKMMGSADYSNDISGDIGASDAGAGEGAGIGMGESLEINNFNEIEISYALKKFINEHKHLIQDEDWDELFEKAEWSLSLEEQANLVEMLQSIGCEFEVLD